MTEYITACPIKYFKNFIDEYGLNKLNDVCENSVWNDISIRGENLNFGRVGYISKVEYTYSKTLEDYCFRFECQLNRGINPEHFELTLSDDKEEFFLTIIE